MLSRMFPFFAFFKYFLSDVYIYLWEKVKSFLLSDRTDELTDYLGVGSISDNAHHPPFFPIDTLYL